MLHGKIYPTCRERLGARLAKCDTFRWIWEALQAPCNCVQCTQLLCVCWQKLGSIRQQGGVILPIHCLPIASESKSERGLDFRREVDLDACLNLLLWCMNRHSVALWWFLKTITRVYKTVIRTNCSIEVPEKEHMFMSFSCGIMDGFP